MLHLELVKQPNLGAVVQHFRSLMAQPDSPIRAIHHQPASAGTFAEISATVDPRLRKALDGHGIERLYSHQAQALEQTACAKNVVVVTPTASGKTLCYNLPVLNRLMADNEARAIYLFPTKALAEDQLHAFQALAGELGSEIRAFTYDGDTPQDVRKAIRSRANAVFTNPDMLHTGILPHHRRTALLPRRLRQPLRQHPSAIEEDLLLLRFGTAVHLLFRDDCQSARAGASANGIAVRAGGSKRRSGRREAFRFLQSAGDQPAARNPPQLHSRDAPHRGGTDRARPADAGVRQ